MNVKKLCGPSNFRTFERNFRHDDPFTYALYQMDKENIQVIPETLGITVDYLDPFVDNYVEFLHTQHRCKLKK